MLRLFTKKTDHPLADSKLAQAMLDELPKNDPLKMVQEITHWMESVREHEDFRVDVQWAVLRLLDEAAQPNVRKLTHDYFVVTALTAVQESRLWTALNEFYTQLAQAYFTLLQRYTNDDKGSAALKPHLALIAARGIVASTGRLKCLATRYAMVKPDIWQQMAGFFATAETGKCLDEAVSVYSGRTTSSVRMEFVTSLMWHASSASTLTRVYLHIAERLAAYLTPHFVLSDVYLPGCLFGMDLVQSSGPARVGAGAVMPSSMRFFAVNSIYAGIDALTTLLNKKIVPDALALGAQHDAEAVRPVLQHLARFLTSPPPMRRAGRHHIDVNMSIARGYAALMEQTDVGLNFSQQADVVWPVEDISLGGFRCVLTAEQGNGIELGMLVGLKPDQLGRWGAGIVRRLIRDQSNQLHVGTEIMSNQVVSINLREQGLTEVQSAIWLTDTERDTGEMSVLLRRGGFVKDCSLHLEYADKNYLLMPLALLESGTDYDLARYRKIESQIETEGEEAY
jgi:hypothetical protein